MRTQVTVVSAGLALVVILATRLGAFQAQEPQVIGLDAAYASFNQEGITSVEKVVDCEQLGQISDAAQAGPPRIVLCVGSDVAAATHASTAGFAVPEGPMPVVTADTGDTLWIAVYLGRDGSMPPAYQVRAIAVTGKTLRVSYGHDAAPVRSCDLRDYLVWAPVGPVESGVYTLELFDVAAGDVTASRPWQVTVR